MLIGARVSDELKVKLEEICEREGKTVSEVVRELIEEYVNLKEEEWQKVKLCIKVPSVVYGQVSLFVDRGFFNNIQEAINDALREWLRIQKKEYGENWDEKLISALEAKHIRDGMSTAGRSRPNKY